MSSCYRLASVGTNLNVLSSPSFITSAELWSACVANGDKVGLMSLFCPTPPGLSRGGNNPPFSSRVVISHALVPLPANDRSSDLLIPSKGTPPPPSPPAPPPFFHLHLLPLDRSCSLTQDVSSLPPSAPCITAADCCGRRVTRVTLKRRDRVWTGRRTDGRTYGAQGAMDVQQPESEGPLSLSTAYRTTTALLSAPLVVPSRHF